MEIVTELQEENKQFSEENENTKKNFRRKKYRAK